MHFPGPTEDAIRGPVVQGLRHGTRAGHCTLARVVGLKSGPGPRSTAPAPVCCVDEEAGPRTAAYSQRQVNMTTPAGIMMEAARYACVAQLGLERLLTHSVLGGTIAWTRRLGLERLLTHSVR